MCTTCAVACNKFCTTIYDLTFASCSYVGSGISDIFSLGRPICICSSMCYANGICGCQAGRWKKSECGVLDTSARARVYNGGLGTEPL